MEARFNTKIQECRTEAELAEYLLDCIPIIKEYTSEVVETVTTQKVLGVKVATRKGIQRQDIYKRYLRPSATDDQLLRVARLSALIGGAAGVVLAVVLQTVIGALTIFYSLLVVTLFVPIVGGLVITRATSRDALASITTGIAVLFVVRFAVTPTFPQVDPTLAGLLAGAAAFGLFCLVPRPAAHPGRV